MKKSLMKPRTCKLQKKPQQNDISTKFLKENLEVVAQCFHENINFCIENSVFPSDLKLVDVTPAFKRNQRFRKITTDPLSFCQIYLRYKEYAITTKSRISLMKYYLNISVDFAKEPTTLPLMYDRELEER